MKNQPKPPPHDLDAEESLLGALMLDGAQWPFVQGSIRGTADFYAHPNQLVWEAIRGMLSKGQHCDYITVKSRLADANKLEEAGGDAYLIGLINNCPGTIGAQTYAKRVREMALRREVIQFGWGMADAAYSRTESSALLGLMQAGMNKVLASRSASSRKLVEVFNESERTIKAAQERRGADGKMVMRGFRFGVPKLDALHGGLTGPRLVVVTMRPKCGKSALLNQGALASAQAGEPGLIITLELGADELGIRWMAHESAQSVSRIHRGYAEEADAGLHAAAALGDLPLWVDDTTNDLDGICASIAWHKHVHGITWAAIDHGGLIRVSEKFSSRNEQQGHISMTLKGLCKTLGIPVVCLLQLSRLCDKENRRPRPDDCRDSGNWEQDADAIVIGHVPIAERDQIIKPVYYGIPANRLGPPVWLDHAYEFNGRTQRIALPPGPDGDDDPYAGLPSEAPQRGGKTREATPREYRNAKGE